MGWGEGVFLCKDMIFFISLGCFPHIFNVSLVPRLLQVRVCDIITQPHIQSCNQLHRSNRRTMYQSNMQAEVVYDMGDI